MTTRDLQYQTVRLTQKHITRLLLFLIIAIALVIRVYGISFGLPFVYHLDEPVLVGTATRMLRTGDMNPHRFDWPSLYFYVQALLYQIIFLVNKTVAALRGQQIHFGDIATWQIYLVGRSMTAIIGTATVALTYKIAKLLSNEKAALLSALVLALSFLHVKHSKFITTNIPVTFVVLVSFYFCVLAYLRGDRFYYIMSGFFVGLSGATKYNGIIVIVSLFAAHFMRVMESREKLLNRKFFDGLAFGLIGFLVGSPYTVLDSATFMRWLSFDFHHYRTGHWGAESTRNWNYFLAYLYKTGLGPAFFNISVLGISRSILTRSKRPALLLVFPFLYFMVASSARVNFVRNLLPILPFLGILGGIGLYQLCLWLRSLKQLSNYKLRIVIPLLLVVLLFQPMTRILRYDYLISQKDTRTIALEWIQRNIPTGSRIAVEKYTPQLSSKSYRIYQTQALFEHTPEWYEKVEFIIASSVMYGRFYRQPKRYSAQIKGYEAILRDFTLTKEFSGDSVRIPGPKIRIYKRNDTTNL